MTPIPTTNIKIFMTPTSKDLIFLFALITHSLYCAASKKTSENRDCFIFSTSIFRANHVISIRNHILFPISFLFDYNYTTSITVCKQNPSIYRTHFLVHFLVDYSSIPTPQRYFYKIIGLHILFYFLSHIVSSKSSLFLKLKSFQPESPHF